MTTFFTAGPRSWTTERCLMAGALLQQIPAGAAMGSQLTKGVICIWLPAFPAWAVARSFNTKSPVAVVQGGSVVAASHHALQSGVRIGMSASRVADVSPRTEMHLRDATCEQAMWDYTLERLHMLTPFLESAERGVAYLRDAQIADLEALAVDLKVCAGTAARRRVARLAAARAAPGYVLNLPKKRVAGFLQHTSVDVFTVLGFDEDIAERLLLFGYPTLDRTATLSERHLKAQFGAAVGGELFAYLNPPRERPIGLFHPPRAAVATYVLEWDEDMRYETTLDAITARLVEDVHEQLKGWCCRRLTARLYDGKTEHAISRILPMASDKLPYLLRQVRALVRPELEGMGSLSTLSIELRSFSVGETQQGSLWRSRPTLEDAARKVEPRFPSACLRTVAVPHALLPEDAYRAEPFVVLNEDER